MIEHVAQGGLNSLCWLELHVGHPHGDRVGGIEMIDRLQPFPFAGVLIQAVLDRIKVCNFQCVLPDKRLATERGKSCRRGVALPPVLLNLFDPFQHRNIVGHSRTAHVEYATQFCVFHLNALRR